MIVLTMLLLYMTNTITLKDGFKVSLTILFTLVGVLQYFIACLMPQQMEDNWGLITITILVAVEILILIVANVISNKIK